MSNHFKIYNNSGAKLFVDCITSQESRGNVIFCCTPVCSVKEVRRCYQPIAESGFNVYALDFSGMGESEGDIRNLSTQGICDDFDSVVNYIMTQSNEPIFLFGDTGIGGLIAQYYASYTEQISGFAQFGCAIYKDASPLNISKTMLTVIYPVVSALSQIAPRLNFNFTAPKYSGYHADIDNGFYDKMLKRNPKFFSMNIKLIKAIMDIICSRNSFIRKGITVPTLVFKTMHDRYFPRTYFDGYYEKLNCSKKLIEIDDVHNSYYFYPDIFAAHVVDWFSKIHD